VSVHASIDALPDAAARKYRKPWLWHPQLVLEQLSIELRRGHRGAAHHARHPTPE
jgi:hypothetical protein